MGRVACCCVVSCRLFVNWPFFLPQAVFLYVKIMANIYWDENQGVVYFLFFTVRFQTFFSFTYVTLLIKDAHVKQKFIWQN